MFKFLGFFANKLRLANPWRYKVPALMAVPYFLLLTTEVDNIKAYIGIALSFCTIVGLAGIAYIFNDAGDREVDLKAGKTNALLGMPKSQVTVLVLAFVLLAIGPWFWFPFDRWSVLLFGGEILLFYLYAFRPFRFKERGWIGVITDALYAHLFPALLAANTFYLLCGSQFQDISLYLVFLGIWQFFLGVRNILLHQLSDEQSDRKSGVNTLVTKLGSSRILRVLNWLIVPAELFSFLVFAWFLNGFIPWFIPALGVFWLISFIRLKGQKIRSIEGLTSSFIDDFYIRWYPILVLSAIVFAPIEVTPIFLAHLILFRNGIVRIIKDGGIRIHRVGLKFGKWFWQPESYLLVVGRNLLFFLGYLGLFIGSYLFIKENFEGQQFLYYQLLLSRVLLVIMFAHLAVILWKRKTLAVASVSTFLLTPGSAYNLAFIRFLFMVGLAGEASINGFGHLSKWAQMPDSAREPLPFIGWFVEWLPITPEIYTIAVWGVIVTSILSALGLFTRLNLVLCIPFGFYMWAVPCFFGKLNHNQLVIWIPFVLSLAPSGDALSLDALIRRIKGKSPRLTLNPNYGLPLKIIWLQLAIIYCFSGLHKLWDTGLAWAMSDSVINQLYNEWFEHYDLIPGIRIDQFPWLVKLGGMGVIFGEILYPLILFHPMLRPLGFIWGQAFHRITDYFVYIDFGHLKNLSWSFINWHSIADFIRMRKQLTREWVKKQLPIKQQFITLNFANLGSGKLTLYAGGIMLVLNGAFSMASIHTWPFSSYPNYSAYFEDYVEVLELEMWDQYGVSINYLEMGKKQGFRWENIRPFETEIINDVQAGDTSNLRPKLKKYVELWQINVHGLDKVASVKASIVKAPLKPEERSETFDRELLMKLNISTHSRP